MIGIGINIGIGRRIGSLLRYLRALFVSEDATSYTLSYTAGVKPTDLQAGVAERGNGIYLTLPAAALVSQDADSFTIETDNL
ncbi:hypothetical protein [Loktanella sp. R86503]|uniref:hypothetical protein n=1 Tax=Loktanella sp. R86503 TaxID=3093847 RepID=UPI0036DCC674